jgi:hypothetical protein
MRTTPSSGAFEAREGFGSGFCDGFAGGPTRPLSLE